MYLLIDCIKDYRFQSNYTAICLMQTKTNNNLLRVFSIPIKTKFLTSMKDNLTSQLIVDQVHFYSTRYINNHNNRITS